MTFLLRTIGTYRWVDPALAGGAMQGITGVGPNLSSGTGEFGSQFLQVALSFAPLVSIIAVLGLTIAGYFMTITGSENQSQSAKRVVISGLSAVILLNLATVMGASYTGVLSDPTGAAATLSNEARSVLTFLEIGLGSICVLMIIVSGIRAITNYGSEEGVTQLRRTVIFVIAGFILAYTRTLLGAGIATGLPTQVLNVIISTTSRIISFTLIIAVAMIVYAAFLMIVNVGKEEQYSKAKGLILRVGIGILVLLTCVAIVVIFVGLVPGGFSIIP
jgi:hypothetical protein